MDVAEDGQPRPADHEYPTRQTAHLTHAACVSVSCLEAYDHEGVPVGRDALSGA